MDNDWMDEARAAGWAPPPTPVEPPAAEETPPEAAPLSPTTSEAGYLPGDQPAPQSSALVAEYPPPSPPPAPTDELTETLIAAARFVKTALPQIQNAVSEMKAAKEAPAPTPPLLPPSYSAEGPLLDSGNQTSEWKLTVATLIVQVLVAVVSVVDPAHILTQSQQALILTVVVAGVTWVTSWYGHGRTKLKMLQIANTTVVDATPHPIPEKEGAV